MSRSFVQTFGDVHPYTAFKFAYDSVIWRSIQPSLLTMWHYFVMLRYDGNSTQFLDEIYAVLNGLYVGIIASKDLFDIIISFCECESWETFTLKHNVLRTLFATSEAHTDREFAYCVLQNECTKWYSAWNDSVETRSPMLLFEFVIPISILQYSLKSANDCPHRDPYHWYLFGVFGEEIKLNNKIVILHE
eukprot:UN07060